MCCNWCCPWNICSCEWYCTDNAIMQNKVRSDPVFGAYVLPQICSDLVLVWKDWLYWGNLGEGCYIVYAATSFVHIFFMKIYICRKQGHIPPPQVNNDCALTFKVKMKAMSDRSFICGDVVLMLRMFRTLAGSWDNKLRIDICEKPCTCPIVNVLASIWLQAAQYRLNSRQLSRPLLSGENRISKSR